MEFEKKNSTLHNLNTIMMWLFCVTIMFLVMPWDKISVELASRLHENRVFLFVALIFEVSCFVSQMVLGVISGMHQKKVAKQYNEQMAKTIESLDFSEKALLREFVLQRKSVLSLPVNEPSVSGLITNHVLKMASSKDTNGKADVVISRLARPFITYKAIGLSLGKLSQEQISQIMQERPEFARPERKIQHAYRSGAYKAA